MTAAMENTVKGLRTFTLQEIDEQLTTLLNVRKHSKSCNVDNVNKKIDIWLDRRFDLQEVGGSK